MPDLSPRSALIIVDMQEDFCEPRGSLALKGGRELASNINELLDFPEFAVRLAARDFHPPDHISFASQHEGASPFTSRTTIRNPENEFETQVTIIPTQKESTLWPDHCVQGTPGCEVIPEINRDRLHKIIDKGTDKRVESYSAFGPPFRDPSVSLTELDAFLKSAEITHVFCVGLSYNVCVFYTAVDAAARGYKTFVIRDATTSRQTEDNLLATRRALEESGVRVIDMRSLPAYTSIS